MSAGGDYSQALRTDGSIEAWGGDWGGVVSSTPMEPGFVLIEAGTLTAIALRADGSIAAWGVNDIGQVTGAPTQPGFVQLAAGDRHFVGLLADNTGTPLCFGDGSGASCPCSNVGAPGAGCANSGGGGADLNGSGIAFFSLDTFQLQVSGIPGVRMGLCVKGSAQLGAGQGIPIGDGLLCLAPQLRSQIVLSDAAGGLSLGDWRGQPFSSYPGAANLGAPTFYQWWYRDPSGSCTGAGFNFTNAWSVTWQL